MEGYLDLVTFLLATFAIPESLNSEDRFVSAMGLHFLHEELGFSDTFYKWI